MNIEDMTVKQIKEIQNMFNYITTTNVTHPWKVDQYYVIRTVTMIQYGKLIAVHDQELVLEDAAWIADTGRFFDFLKDPDKCNECEPLIGTVIVGRGSVIDAHQVTPFKVSQK